MVTKGDRSNDSEHQEAIISEKSVVTEKIMELYEDPGTSCNHDISIISLCIHNFKSFRLLSVGPGALKDDTKIPVI